METRTLILLVAVLVPTLAQAQAGRIEQVLVYPGGASVERVLAVKAGQQQLKIACLPARFDTDSLQLRAAQGSGLAIGEITVQTVARAALPECADSPLDTRIRELQDQQAALAAETDAHDLALGYLKNYTAPSGQSASIAATAETLRRSGLDTLQRQQALQRRKQELERLLAPLTAERDRLVQANPQLRTVVVRLAAPRDAELRLSYRLSQAGWEPVYRAYLDSRSGQVRLERHAQVAQQSGEDWTQVKLRLSTTQPRQATGMPPPKSWTLDLLPPPSAELARPAPTYAAAAAAPAPRVQRADGPELDFNVAVFHGEFATEFEVPGRVSIATDGQRIGMALGHQMLDAQLMARANPSAEAQAYLVAESARPTGVWPVGLLQLFRDGDFVGQSQLRLANQDRLDLFFGRDERLRVTVEPEQRKAGDRGLIGSRVEQQLGRAYRIENLQQRHVSVQILEAAPVARHDDIKVLTRFDPEPAIDSWRQQPGIVAWQFELAPGQSQRLTAGYVIGYPKDARVGGLR
ncbi:DUF4139 domain-containing protein [Paucibacter sp. PLA-PC-4]|uniref:DUF4139 domain-containing protein n=1 Tax=Paucibacter sp. PLA-PC-4 TaxID=2993655 RepID=UPI00224ADEDB|nr:DUF4139 domain-containing protein [Paucibacter sp. PLA-PC-4]MCX2864039.1 DUF4139 domain-containing protein [Paucibacter sp. PLA-PC-4]